MDKAILKKFAIESRKDLMQRMENKIKAFYIDEKFSKQQSGDVYILANSKHSLSLSKEEYEKRELLIKRINELGLDQVIEEAAYTWFNRIVAIRYMEIHDYLPLTKDNQSLGIRVLSSRDNTPDPEIIKFTNLVNPDLDIDFKKEKYVELKSDSEKFKYVLLLVCKKLGRVIPQVFDGITDYVDILIPDNLLNDTGFITKVIYEVPENNYSQVEIIGWLYQYYNQAEKDRVISAKKPYKKNEIAYATQLFTPDWIVKYMVENSLGKFWIEHGGNKELINNWKYYIDGKINYKNESINPQNIKCFDPCMGSGHILVYLFEVLYQIYESFGYNKNDIPELILKNNIYGLDIDDRAGQLAILSVLLKAREYDRNIFNKNIYHDLKIQSISESNNFDYSLIQILNENEKEIVENLIKCFKDAKDIGSLNKLTDIDLKALKDLEEKLHKGNDLFTYQLKYMFYPIIREYTILKNKYDVVVTNPPYMRLSKTSKILNNYLAKNYKTTKYDLYSAFIEKIINMLDNKGIMSMITPQAWMFLTTFEDLRKSIINNMNIDNVMQLGTGAFDCGFGTASFVLRKEKCDTKSCFLKLDLFDTEDEKIKNYFIDKNKYYIEQSKFLSIPSTAFAYWISDGFMNAFKNKRIKDYYEMESGIVTGNNEKYLRYWYEVNDNLICKNNLETEVITSSGLKWFKCNKGGGYKRWYGNMEYVVNLYHNAKNIRENISPDIYRLRNIDNYSRKAITWPLIGDKKFSAKFLPNEVINNKAANALYLNDEQQLHVMGYMNSKVFNEIINMINPTVSYPIVDIEKIPVIPINNENIIKKVKENIKISKEDWDSFETSWDFTKHPLLKPMSKDSTIRDSLANWNTYTYQQRSLLKHNEEELNKIFIDIYGLNDELTPEVDDKDITIRKEDKVRDIKSFISYSVGCMFGRYSLDRDELIFAGGVFDENNYKTFKADNDNIIPITDEVYFSNDIVERFKTFIKTVYGDNTFNENMDYIAEALGKKGTETSEETIRRYFVNDFFNDHVKAYQKRPIYWLLDSGKKNGFKALIYMHRYNENLMPKARLDYLHRVQTTYEKLLSDVNYKLTTDLSMVDKKDAQKRQADLNAKLQEIKEYDEKIAHIANQKISIDLDDGVKVNYEKFKDILAKIK